MFSRLLQHLKRISAPVKTVENLSFALRHCSHNANRVDYISVLLGITKGQAVKLLNRNRHLKHLEKQRLEETIAVLKQLKFDNKSVLESPKIFNVPPNVIQQRFQCLSEFDFPTISVHHIIRYPSIVCWPPSELYNQHILTEKSDPLASLISHAKGPTDMETSIRTRYGSYLTSSSLDKMRCAVILEYLSWMMQESIGEICDVVERCPSICGLSLKVLDQNWTILTQKYFFNVDGIKNNIFMLNVQPDNLLKLLEQYVHLACVGIKALAMECPRILTMSSRRLAMVEDLLKKFGISDQQMARCVEVFLIEPIQLQNRLSEVRTTPGLEIIQDHPQFLHLVCSNGTFKGWGACTQNMGVGGITMVKWCSISNEILKSHTVREFCHNSKHRHDLEVYLSDRLGRSEAQIRLMMATSQEWNEASVLDVSESLTFLEHAGFSSDQILQALSILLLDPSELQRKYSKLMENLERKSFVQTVSHPLSLKQLLAEFQTQEDKEKNKKIL